MINILSLIHHSLIKSHLLFYPNPFIESRLYIYEKILIYFQPFPDVSRQFPTIHWCADIVGGSGFYASTRRSSR